MASHNHGGHRARLRERARMEGIGAFQPHEVLELALFFGIPRRDVNPLAHELIDRFGSLGGVLNAPREELARFPGLGGESAGWLGLLGEAASRYGQLKLTDRPRIECLSHARAHFARVFEETPCEQIWLFSMNPGGGLLGSTLVSSGEERTRMSLRRLMEPAIRYRARSALLVQRRRRGNLAPDQWDIDTTWRLARLMRMVSIQLEDSLLLAGSSMVSLRRDGLYYLESGEERVLNEAAPPDRWLE